MAHCPYTNTRCKLEQRYNTTELTAGVINAIADRFAYDDDNAFEAMNIASAKEYLGDMCMTCGSFFPVTFVVEKE